MALVAFEIAIAGLELGLCVIELLTWPGFEWTHGELGPLTRAFRLADIVALIFLVHLVATIFPLFRDCFRGSRSNSGSKRHLYFRVFAINTLVLLILFMNAASDVHDWVRLRLNYNLIDVQAHFGDLRAGVLLMMRAMVSMEPWGTVLILVAALVSIVLCPAEFLALKLMKRVMDFGSIEGAVEHNRYLNSPAFRVVLGVMLFASSFAIALFAYLLLLTIWRGE